MTRSFPFRFETRYRIAALPFGVTPGNAMVELDDDSLRVRFGPWRLETDLANVTGTEESGAYSFLKTAGPAHLSRADKGITFATNGDRGLCLQLAEPVPGIDPWGRTKHPGVTVTVDDVDGLREALQR